MIRIINLCPHDVTIYSENGIRTFKSRKVARRKEIRKKVGRLGDIDLYRLTFSEPINLPPQEEGVYYIVSAIVKMYSTRKDLLSPGVQIRDKQGNTIGCKGLIY